MFLALAQADHVLAWKPPRALACASVDESIEVRVGRRIAVYRNAAGLTQPALAERCGLAVETIGRIERGRQMPSLARLETLARALGVSLSALVRERRHVGRRERALAALTHLLRERPATDAEMLVDIARIIFRARSQAG